MRFSTAIAATALVAGASATYNYTEAPVYTTEVVTEFTTYCPGPTQITHGGSTYTITSETTLTITNCPCTVTYPVTSTPAPVPSTYVPPPPVTSSYVPPPVYTPPYNNGTTSTYVPPTTAPSSPPVYTSTGTVPVPTGAANQAVAASGAGLAAVLGFVAYVL